MTIFEIEYLLPLIPGLPLTAALLTALLGPKLLRGKSHWPTVAAIGLSLLASLVLLIQVHRAMEAEHAGAAGAEGSTTAENEQPESTAAAAGFERLVTLWTWAAVGEAYALPEKTPAGSSGAQAPQAGEPDSPSAAASPGALEPAATARTWRDFRIEIVLRADALTAIMLVTVTLISFLVAVYSIGYMHDDPGYWRFFTFISVFVFSMTMLVAASNFLLLYVFWEAVGFCSYILIGFWYQRPAAAAAGKKAFLVNRVGDFGFALGVFLLWTTYGTLNFHDTEAAGGVIHGVLGEFATKHPETFYVGGGLATAICLLLMLGACGKSAQFPLHVWLPDAMEGPTPVSALIHAATMVTAGVYMVARCLPLFAAADYALEVVAVIGAFTAVLAALIAVTQTDLKRILAYSTISQLGYMFLGLGAATLLGATAGMFHLFTHAFFKALLFLGAGSVMHAMGGVIDVRRFGGLRRLMPVTHLTFLFGCLALAGLFPFAGFWSKDLILAAVAEQHAPLYRVLYLAALGTAGLTAFYTFRAYFLTFWGRQRVPEEAGPHAHESPGVMTWPLVVLAVGSLVVGAYFEWTGQFEHFLALTPSLVGAGKLLEAPGGEHASHLAVALWSTAVVLVGIGAAWVLYAGPRVFVEACTRLLAGLGLYQLSRDKFFFDEIYGALVVAPLRGLAALSEWFDRLVIDRLVNACGAFWVLVGAMLRPLQNGLVQFYALAMVLGLLVLIGTLLL